MRKLLLWTARTLALVGLLVCAAAAIGRLMGLYAVGSFSIGTLFMAGVAAIVIACLAYLVILVEGPDD